MAPDPERQVGDLVQLVRGTTYKGALLGKPGPALLGLGSIIPGGGFRVGEFKTYGGECPEKLTLHPGDLYVSLKGATKDGDMIGSIARVPPQVPSGRLTQDTVKLVLNAEAEKLRAYLYWLLRTPQYRAYCAGRATGSAVVALSRDDFLSYPVPPLTAEREMIVEVLEHIEEKVDLTRRMNATLEATTQAIFRDWFIDFGPTRRKTEGATDPGTILGGLATNVQRAVGLADLFPATFDENGLPTGWVPGTLKELATQASDTVTPTEIDPSTPYIGLEHMPRHSVALSEWEAAQKVTSNKSRFTRGQILFGKLRPYFHKVGAAPVDGICSTDIVVLDAIQPIDRVLVLACVSTDEFVAFTDQTSTGTKMPRTNWKTMQTYSLAIAKEGVRRAFADIANPLLAKIEAGIHESKTLLATRDLLLSRLMSGEVRLREAEDRLQEVA